MTTSKTTSTPSILRVWTTRMLIAAILLSSLGDARVYAGGFQAAPIEVKTLSAMPEVPLNPALSLAPAASLNNQTLTLPSAVLPGAAPAQAAAATTLAPSASQTGAATGPAAAHVAAPAATVMEAAAQAGGQAADRSRTSIEVLQTTALEMSSDQNRGVGDKHFDGLQAGGETGSGSSSGGSSNSSGNNNNGGKQAPAGLPSQAPVMALNMVIFPGRIVNLNVTGPEARNVILAAVGNGGYMIAATRPDSGAKDSKGYSPVATLVKLSNLVSDGDKTSVRMEAVRSVNIDGYAAAGKGIELAKVSYPSAKMASAERMSELAHLAHGLVYEFARLDPDLTQEFVSGAMREDDPMRLTSTLAHGMPFSESAKLRILALPAGEPRLQGVVLELMSHFKALATPAEEGGIADSLASPEAFAAKVDAIGMPAAVKAQALKEYQAFAALNPKDGEAAKLRTYLQWLVDMPWSVRSADNFDSRRAAEILNRDHFGLDKVKQRVLEFLAVRKKTGSKKGTILLFVGPPGVGKTSIASSIAAALDRKFVRLSLGGVHDESVLRGHGRTYQGSLPGQIVRQMKAAGTVNPVMLLDEVDKVGRAGAQGDPTAALLEILDPQQNGTFRDHYLDVPYDLSEVIFVVTANDRSSIPGPLQDRMEIIEFDGYTPLEKMGIAERHIIPEKLKANGLTAAEAGLTKDALRKIIEGYTMESGVRNLRETLDAVFRKVAAWIETRGEKAPGVIDAKDVAHYLGVESHSARDTTANDVGVATGLAVNDYGGSTMNVVVRAIPGSGRVRGRTQQLEMIKDSAENALTYVRTNAAKFGLEGVDFSKIDLDIAFTPAGKIDGPSAGGLMTTAIISELTGRKVAAGLAMTGEVTPDGRILPIGGLKQKVMAAHRMGYKMVIFPAANEKDVESIPEEVRQGIVLKSVRTYDEIFPFAIAEQVAGRGVAFMKMPQAEPVAGAGVSAVAATVVPSAAWAVRGPITVTLQPTADPRDPTVVITGPQGVVDRYPLHEAREVVRQATKRWWNPSTWSSRMAEPATMDVEAQQAAVTAYADLLAAKGRRR
jgi:ATP-dependent Lon protease